MSKDGKQAHMVESRMARETMWAIESEKMVVMRSDTRDVVGAVQLSTAI
jgi:hypothetical protein